jgi:hypothetical protein
MDKIEYRVRPVTRYIVTRFHSEAVEGARGSVGSSVVGEYDNHEMAYEVGYALCKAEHDRLGWPPGDERIQYPGAVVPESAPA